MGAGRWHSPEDSEHGADSIGVGVLALVLTSCVVGSCNHEKLEAGISRLFGLGSLPPSVKSADPGAISA